MKNQLAGLLGGAIAEVDLHRLNPVQSIRAELLHTYLGDRNVLCLISEPRRYRSMG